MTTPVDVPGGGTGRQHLRRESAHLDASSSTARTPPVALTAICALTTVVLAVLAVGEHHPTASPHLAWWALAPLFAVAEVEGLGLVRDRETVSSPTARIVLVVGLYLAAPLELIAAHALGSLVAAAPRWRTSPRRAAFQVVGSTLSTTVGAWGYLVMTELTAPRGPEGWADGTVAAAAAVVVATVLGAATRRAGTRRQLVAWVARISISDVLAVATGLVAAEILRTDRYAAWLLVLPALAAYAVRSQYEIAGWRADALGTLHHVAQRLQRSRDRVGAAELAVEQARVICRAERADLVIHDDDGRMLRRTSTPPPAPSGVGATLPRPIGRHRQQRLILPLLSGGVPRGQLRLVRRGGRFTQLEVQVAETLIASLGATLETLTHLESFAERHVHAAQMLDQREQVNRELRRVSDAKSVFLATTSHELRAPLSALLAETELLVRLLPADSDDTCHRLVAGARSNAAHLLFLVDALLDLSRIEAGRLVLNVGTVDLRELADEVTASMQPVLMADGVDLRIDGSPRAELAGDRGRLRQVLTNLIDNAARATAAGGAVEVEVEVEAEADTVTVHVRDSGRGIPPEDLERMFAPFERGVPYDRGLGLGLTISRHLVEAHGGHLRVHSVVDVGSCFTATLPAHALAAGVDEVPAVPTASPPR